jgi:glycosyl transferase family 2
MPGTSGWQLRDGEQIITSNTSLLGRKHFLIGITRVRNEALILRDTLDYVGTHVDAIVAYDDASTDRTLEILGGHPKVALIVTNRSWEADIEARRIAEGRHRGLLLQTAREQLQFDWIFCFDADEHVTGDLRGFIEGTHSSDYDGVRVQLFDAYMTPGDHASYQADRELLGFRRFFGPERRDILMLWRNRSEVIFAKRHAREPGGVERVGTGLYCQHYGTRPLGRDLRILCGTLSVRYLRTKMAAIAKVEQSTSNLTLCGPCTSGVTRSSRMRSRCDLSENRAFLPARANVTAWLTGSRRASRFSQKRPLHSAGHSIFHDRFKPTGVSEDPESRYYPSQVRDFFRGPVQSREGDGEN